MRRIAKGYLFLLPQAGIGIDRATSSGPGMSGKKFRQITLKLLEFFPKEFSPFSVSGKKYAAYGKAIIAKK